MMEDRHSPEHQEKHPKPPEARYNYYRRCQLFRRNGEQCKAPAEKGATICHAHAAQQAMAFRWDLERQIVLAKAVAEMRRRGKPECEMADLFTDFKGIQLTLAEVSRALIHGRIDCKTAGRLLVHLQTMSKLLWMVHRKGREGRKENQGVPQICAEARRSNKSQEPGLPVPLTALTPLVGRDIGGEESRVAFEAKVRRFPESRQGCRDGPWQQARAA
ncbi:MAG: hypothetical protein ACXVJ0_05550, partial [Candidatus Angelobacter sp.]